MVHDSRMWFGNFFLRSIWLSLTVALFWLPVLVIFGYGVRFVFEILKNEPIALGMVIVLSIQPVLVLLSIFAIRGGMMALKVTRGTDLNSLGKVVFRIVRFNLPLMWVVTVLFGLSTTITGLRLMESNLVSDIQNLEANEPVRTINSDFGAQFQRVTESESKLDISNIIDLAGEFPVILVGGWLLGACIAFALLGVSVAAQSARAVDKPPNHHTIWGMASEFSNLLVLSLVLVIVPFIIGVGAIGIDATLADLTALDTIVFYSALGYGTWAICALAAGAALAYSLTLKSTERKHQAILAAIGGAAQPTVDLKSLRQSRMKK
ncbi:MAG: hypothetical protein JKY41_09380 [Rhodobacteraceae bacterium]|nr:hypothetical protein [Paracoccaceae bacterium]